MLLGVAVDGVGWRHLRRLAVAAERAGLDFVTLDDSLALTAVPDGQPDAVTALAAVAPATRTIGLVATVTTTYAEPFQVARALATLDHLSHGRAGWRPRVAASPAEAAHFGPEPLPEAGQLLSQAAEFTDVVTALWDSWQDDAVIRDTMSGRFLDRARVRHIDHVGQHFRIRGPAVVPRPPQGHPVLASGPGRHSSSAAACGADLVFTEVHEAQQVRARVGAGVRILGEVEMLCAESAAELAARLDAVYACGAVDGFHVRPAALPGAVERLVHEVVPLLRRRHPARSGTPGGSLRERLGLPARAPSGFPLRKASASR
ncbi:alkanesulfonate monooxygenase SsuD/methylene tetrahydromethanopterin reductase-like flavin-dependent oxidoreductase (luciferase family) [Kitasatospora sp. MAA4]|uniref:LLM class flavin-dependent oxidoreductase n=1 Tax=Kitasatospora sp. MAA4 TaxID=3035093 RepID=UPI002474AB6D|nr:LLM class flavin-dependent oxidoreductase [Kitasatospora sp. MAA4]MDH6130923.1 alkanesulfonate monooxygenase SsuD/methylene tetrahydromethanopterin reductase-like flavin-dependent oxidoreductase (luciferase family) [Kitasatospora sp. MAA4]